MGDLGSLLPKKTPPVWSYMNRGTCRYMVVCIWGTFPTLTCFSIHQIHEVLGVFTYLRLPTFQLYPNVCYMYNLPVECLGHSDLVTWSSEGFPWILYAGYELGSFSPPGFFQVKNVGCPGNEGSSDQRLGRISWVITPNEYPICKYCSDHHWSSSGFAATNVMSSWSWRFFNAGWSFFHPGGVTLYL